MRTLVTLSVVGLAALLIGILAAGPAAAEQAFGPGSAMLIPTYLGDNGSDAPAVLLARHFHHGRFGPRFGLSYGFGTPWYGNYSYGYNPYSYGYYGYSPGWYDSGTQVCEWNGYNYTCFAP